MKLVKGADFTTEFTAVQAALNSKVDGAVQFFPDGTAGQPSVGFTNNAGTGMFNAAGVLGFATSGTQRLSIAAGGLVTAANGLTVSGAAFTSRGITDNATATALTLASGGIITTAAPSSTGGGFGNYAVNIACPTTAGSSYGFYLKAGTSAADRPFLVNNAADSLSLLQLLGDGSFSVGQPVAGQSGGLGSLNCSALYVAGVPTYPNVPFHSVSGSYTPVLADGGKTLDCAASTAVTLPLNASVSYPLGTVITILADFGAGSMTVAAGAGDTLFLGGSVGTTGTRTLAPMGLATVLRISTAEWVIQGSGVT